MQRLFPKQVLSSRSAVRYQPPRRLAVTPLVLSLFLSSLPATQATAVVYPVGAGSSHSLYIKNPVANPQPGDIIGDNPVYGMGQQSHHELADFLGNWTGSPAATPLLVGCHFSSNFLPRALYTAMAVAGGRSHSVAIRNDGTVITWGDNSYGQIGRGSIGGDFNCADQAMIGVPLAIRGTPTSYPIFAIAAGDYHTYALVGTALPYSMIRSWGRSNAGQVGNGKATGSNYPTPDCVRNNVYPTGVCLTAVRSIAAGAAHGVAATLDGKVYTWGSDSDGQRGEPGINADRSWALEVPGIDNVISVAARGYITLALKQDGTV